MAKKTFTEIATTDRDEKSPIDEPLVTDYRDNEITLLKHSFPLLWRRFHRDETDTVHDIPAVWLGTGFQFTWIRFRPWIYPGMKRLVLSFLTWVEHADTVCNMECRIQVADAPGSPGADIRTISNANFNNTTTPTRTTYTFQASDLERRWGRRAIISVYASFNTAPAGPPPAGTYDGKIGEDANLTSYWEQAL